MKKSLLVSAFLMSLTILTTGLTTAALATDYQVQTTSKTTNIRAKGNPKAKLVTKVPAGTKLRILARNNETDISKLWLKVETDQGKQGWVAAKVTKLVKPTIVSTPDSMQQYNADSPAAAAPAPEPAAPMDTEAPTPPTSEQQAAPAPAPSTDDIPDIEILDSTDNK